MAESSGSSAASPRSRARCDQSRLLHSGARRRERPRGQGSRSWRSSRRSARGPGYRSRALEGESVRTGAPPSARAGADGAGTEAGEGRVRGGRPGPGRAGQVAGQSEVRGTEEGTKLRSGARDKESRSLTHPRRTL